ncbi:hypothetical protein N7533_013584 [Penicillium manginii]|uniref:uncharacterized protein n=1 Tax=Penicillium manginii TaxID=203109 RepID=UPI002547F2BA|nr:uncharacterized protein N7533_013584 [Penicillium manginii]KAJ5733137.1 hypothetical protein N7533_013584 [Penicillium manginii]
MKCQPTLDLWGHRLKNGLLMMASAIATIPKSKTTLSNFSTTSTILLQENEGKLQDKHLCQDDEGMQPFLDCLNNNAFSAVASSLPRLARYMSEEKCKKATEYFTSAQLWETDFPYHLQPCINQCHEL